MRRIKLCILASTALSMGFAHSAAAADMPVKGPVYKAPAAAPVYGWTGFYVGGNIGYSWGRAHTDLTLDPIVDPSFTFPGGTFGFPLKPAGVIGGAQIGYNWQGNNNWVFGIEADLQASGQKDSQRRTALFLGVPCTTTCDFASTTDITAKLSWFGTVRGRIGQDWNGTFVYATGGLAYGRFKVSGTNTVTVDIDQDGTIDATFARAFNYSKTSAGWTLGAGLEGRAWATNWTWKIEYLYLDLGSAGVSVPGLSVHTTDVTDHIVRVGLNYRLAPGPVVAKY